MISVSLIIFILFSGISFSDIFLLNIKNLENNSSKEIHQLELIDVSPHSDLKIHSDQEVVFTFNAPIGLNEFQKSFQIYPSNDFNEGDYKNNGFFNGNFYHHKDAHKNDNLNQITIKPEPNFKHNQIYTLIINKGLISKGLGYKLEKKIEEEFRID